MRAVRASVKYIRVHAKENGNKLKKEKKKRIGKKNIYVDAFRKEEK